MSRASLAAALALVLIISLLVTAPARVLGLVLPGEQLVLQGYSGTLWRGSASRALLQVGSLYLHLGAVRWRLRPWSFVLLAPRLSLDSQWGNQRLQGELVMRGGQDLDLHDFEASVAAGLLRNFVPVALAGTLTIQVDELQLRNHLPVAGDGSLVWRNAAWQSPNGLLQLGTYALDFQPAPGAGLAGEVLTVSGPVEASGTVQLEDGFYTVDVVVGSKAPLDPQLAQALSLFARPEGGAYQIKLSGEL